MENKKIKNATPNTYNGVHYRSKLETDCAKFFESSKILVEYEKHTYELIPQRVYLGEVFKPVTYTPDFVGESFIVECKGFPNEIEKFLHYTRDLTFDETPDYNYLHKLLKSICENNNIQIDHVFDWTIKLSKKSKGNKNNNYVTKEME